MWVSLALPCDSQSPQTILKQWFFSPSPADEACGNVPLIDGTEFDAHVRCVSCDGGDENIDLFPVRALDPLRDAYFLFYSVRHAFGELHVLGGLPYACVVHELQGCVPRARLLLPSARSRVFWPPFGMLSPTMMERQAPSRADLFMLPDNAGWRRDGLRHVTIMHDFGSEMLQWDQIERAVSARVSWIMGRGQRVNDAHGALDAASAMLAWCVGETLHFQHAPVLSNYDGVAIEAHYASKRHYAHYEHARLAAEEGWFRARLARFACSEDVLLALLKWRGNALESYIAQHLVLHATAQDRAAFLACYPRAHYMPDVFWCVGVENVPSTLAAALPKYRGGYVHLPCWHEAVADWVWHSHVASLQRRHTLERRTDWERIRLTAAPPQLIDLLDRLAARITDWLKKPAGPIKPIKPAGSIKPIKPAAGPIKQLADIEDVPPCVRRVVGFPRNFQRLTIVSIMVHAGASDDAIRIYFERLNDAYPANGKAGTTLKQRPFDVADATRRARAKDDPPWCNSIIANALRGRHDMLQCPFAAAASVQHADKTMLNAACYEACSPGKRFGGRPQNWMKKKPLAAVDKVEDDDEEEEEEVWGEEIEC